MPKPRRGGKGTAQKSTVETRAKKRRKEQEQEEQDTVSWEEVHTEEFTWLKSGEEEISMTEPGLTMEMEERVANLEAQLQQALGAVTKLTETTRGQEEEIGTLKDEVEKAQKQPTSLPATQPTQLSSEKTALPQKYDGSTNLTSYLVQFEALAQEQAWGYAKKGIVLLGRLKGRALDVATQGENHSYPELIKRLKRHFVPDSEEMFAQQLHAIKKQPSQTWEDLAFQVRETTEKAYRTAGSPTQERLAMGAFINAIPNDQLRQKLRDSDLKTMEEVLNRIRKLEADQEIEAQRGGKKKEVRAVQDERSQDGRMKELEKQVRNLQAVKGRSQRSDGRIPQRGRGSRRPWPGGRGRGRGTNSRQPRVCFFCEAPNHFLRECPLKKTWIEQQRQQYCTTAYGTHPPQSTTVSQPQTSTSDPVQNTPSFPAQTQTRPYLN